MARARPGRTAREAQGGKGGGLFFGLSGGRNAARHGAFAAFAAVGLRGVGGLSFDDGDFAAALVARMFGTEGEPLLIALARRARVVRIADHDGFAAVTLHGNDVVRANALGLGERGEWLGALPVLGSGAGECG